MEFWTITPTAFFNDALKMNEEKKIEGGMNNFINKYVRPFC